MARLAMLLVLVATVTAACGGSKEAAPPTTSTSGSATTTSAAPRNVKVFFLEGEQFHAVTRPVASGANAARAAVQSLLDGPTAAEILKQGNCRFAIIETRHDRAFAQRAEAIGLRYSLRGKLDNYFNFNGGRTIGFAIYRSDPRR